MSESDKELEAARLTASAFRLILNYGLKTHRRAEVNQTNRGAFCRQGIDRPRGRLSKTTRAVFAPGDPARRDLEASIREELTEQARRVGLWTLELPESFGGSTMSAIDRVLIHREFGRSVLPFRPVSLPAFMFESKYGADLAAGKLALVIGFRRGPQNRRARRPANFVSARADGLCSARCDHRRPSIRTRISFYFRRGNKARNAWVCLPSNAMRPASSSTMKSTLRPMPRWRV